MTLKELRMWHWRQMTRLRAQQNKHEDVAERARNGKLKGCLSPYYDKKHTQISLTYKKAGRLSSGLCAGSQRSYLGQA